MVRRLTRKRVGRFSFDTSTRADMSADKKLRVSLCAIAGNAEKYIERWLDSFQPWFDEVVIVSAIGKQEFDRTPQIAQERGCVWANYTNAPGNDWPHVDDFAAARNKSFDMATGDFVMWADIDDVLENGEAIRRDLEALPDDALALSVPYDVRDDQLRIMRERIIRKGAARWVNPIHEQLDFPNGVKCGETNAWQVVHLPLGKRTANDERNVRILESIESPNGSQRFHLVQSLRAVGRVEDAVRLAAKIVTDRPEDLGDSEIYELFFTLAQLTGDPETRAKLMLQALAIDPSRREAYGDLAMSYIGAGQPEHALAMSQAMHALSLPQPPPWNIRRKYYGYAGKQILGASLRACGRIEEADAIETNHFILSGKKISLLHATRGRPVMAAQTRRKWLETAANPDAIEHIFALDADDPSWVCNTINRHIVLHGNGGPVAAWNAAAIVAQGDVLIQLSDDWEPFQGWDTAILNEIGDTSKPAVLAIHDGHRKDDLLCMAILTRARYEIQKHVFHPDFFSMFSDNWFSECAWRDGVVIDAREKITFEHIHPAFGKAEMDQTYARSNAAERYEHGAAVLERLRSGREDISQTGIFDVTLHDTQFNSQSLAKWLVANLDKSIPVNDLGCGNGFIVNHLAKEGFIITGYEGNPVKYWHIKADLTLPIEFGKTGQTVCVEVGEHIPPQYTAQLLENIADSTDSGCLAVISWALPGQPGRGHVNCLSNSDAIRLIESAGFEFLKDKTEDIRRSIDDLPWLQNTLHVFRKR